MPAVQDYFLLLSLLIIANDVSVTSNSCTCVPSGEFTSFQEDVNCRDFGYKGSMGPDHWADEYTTCNGKHQSPININILNVRPHNFPELIREHFYAQPLHGVILNNGHTAIVRFKFPDEPAIILGGPLPRNSNYSFVQLHFHWGQNDFEGSEDRINDQTYPAELHMVFSNTKYADFDEAVRHNNGIAVLAFFFAIGQHDNPNYAEFSELLDQIREPNASAEFRTPPMLKDLMPKNVSEYYTYIGSLTTPPCSEDVTWIDFPEPIPISERQIQKFRALNGTDGAPMAGNFRPIQPLNNRTVFKHLNTGPLEGVPLHHGRNVGCSISHIAEIITVISVTATLLVTSLIQVPELCNNY